MSQLFVRRDVLRTLGQAVLGATAFGVSGLACARPAGACGPRAEGPGGAPPSPAAPMACRPTAANIEGPFFKAGAPTRSILAAPTDDGERFVLTGRVLAGGCAPIVGARIEIWHADAHGAYDNEGHHFRGVLETDARGAFRLHTILPGRYLNGRKYRPAHIHAKVHVPGRPVLTTQLYFEGDPENQGDPFIVESLVMRHAVVDGARRASFDFVV